VRESARDVGRNAVDGRGEVHDLRERVTV